MILNCLKHSFSRLNRSSNFSWSTCRYFLLPLLLSNLRISRTGSTMTTSASLRYPKPKVDRAEGVGKGKGEGKEILFLLGVPYREPSSSSSSFRSFPIEAEKAATGETGTVYLNERCLRGSTATFSFSLRLFRHLPKMYGPPRRFFCREFGIIQILRQFSFLFISNIRLLEEEIPFVFESFDT